MKTTKLLTALILAGGAMASQHAAAAGGTITFNGSLYADTCTVTTGGTGTFTVSMPNVLATAMAPAGTTGGQTPFTIDLENCSPGAKVYALFAPQTPDSTNGDLLGNVFGTGAATGVGVALYEQGQSGTNYLKLGTTTTAAAQGHVRDIRASATGTASLPYDAYYYSTAAAPVAGGVQAVATYTIVYE